MKIKRIIASMLIVGFTLMAGCSYNDDKEKADELEGSIVVWTNSESMDVLKLSSENFKKLHNKVSIDIKEAKEEDIFSKLSTSLTEKSNIPDVICIQDEDTQLFIKNFSKDLEETSGDIKKDDYLGYKIDNLTLDGKLYGIPLSSNNGAIIYRTDILSSAGINVEYIKTWNDFIESGEKILKNNKRKMIGLSKDTEVNYRMFLNQLGESYFGQDGKPAINTEKSVRIIEVLKSIYNSALAQNMNSDEDLISSLKSGTIASTIIDLQQANLIEKQLPNFKDKFKIMKLPSFEEGGNQSIVLGGDNLMVINGKENKDLALQFCKFTAEDKDNIVSYLKNIGSLPAYAYYYDEDWFQNKNEYFQGEKLWKFYADLAEDIYTINYTDNFSKTKSFVQQAVNNILFKNQDVKNVMDELSNKLSENANKETSQN